jgi:hypothetical protein
MDPLGCKDAPAGCVAAQFAAARRQRAGSGCRFVGRVRGLADDLERLLLGLSLAQCVRELELTYRGDIDRPPEQRRKRVLEVCRVEQRTAWLELDNNVEVTILGLVSSCHRAERGDSSALVARNNGLDRRTASHHEVPRAGATSPDRSA